MASKKIVVLLHAQDCTFESSTYYLRLLIDERRGRGFVVELIRGVDRFVPADLVIPHIDLTVLPDEYREFLKQYPNAINRNISNISKSSFSTNRLALGDSYDGPVIVKTDRNFGGQPERALMAVAAAKPSILRRIINKVGRTLSGKPTSERDWASVESMESAEYPVFGSLAEVPTGVFDNMNLIVEKFLPERVGDDYGIRLCMFLGYGQAAIELWSKSQVVKATTAHNREEIVPAPELTAIRKRMGIDYGKFDYVIRDGKIELFDVSLTPTFYRLVPLSLDIARRMAAGIDGFLGDPPS